MHPALGLNPLQAQWPVFKYGVVVVVVHETQVLTLHKAAAVGVIVKVRLFYLLLEVQKQ
jgi:hypothetical protein